MMIDIHSHVLPGLDDGAADSDEAIQMLEQYAEQGATTIVCTPHLLPEHFVSLQALNGFLGRRDETLAQLRAVAGRRDIPVTLLPGAEVLLGTAMLPYLKMAQLAERFTLNRGSHVLVELPRMLAGGIRALEGLLLEIQLAGYQPVLAHPERTAHQEGVLPVLRDWVESGRVLLQANSGHLVDDTRGDPERRERYRKRKVLLLQMIGQGLIHCMASDAHDPQLRLCQSRQAREALAGCVDEETIERMFVDNPNRIVHGS